MSTVGTGFLTPFTLAFHPCPTSLLPCWDFQQPTSKNNFSNPSLRFCYRGTNSVIGLVMYTTACQRMSLHAFLACQSRFSKADPCPSVHANPGPPSCRDTRVQEHYVHTSCSHIPVPLASCLFYLQSCLTCVLLPRKISSEADMKQEGKNVENCCSRAWVHRGLLYCPVNVAHV